jgi:hypothetical protein
MLGEGAVNLFAGFRFPRVFSELTPSVRKRQVYLSLDKLTWPTRRPVRLIFKCIIPVVFYANKEGVGPSKHNLFMYYSVYYAHDDMFRQL